MNIFILEDDFVQQAHLEKIIKEIRVQYNLHFKTVETFAKPVQLLESIYEIGLHNLFLILNYLIRCSNSYIYVKISIYLLCF